MLYNQAEPYPVLDDICRRMGCKLTHGACLRRRARGRVRLAERGDLGLERNRRLSNESEARPRLEPQLTSLDKCSID